MRYKHTQIGYLMLAVLLAVAILFTGLYVTASYYSGEEVFATVVMILVVFILTAFVSLQVSIDEECVRIRFSYGLFRKKFPLQNIVSVRAVKNLWYYGWGIRVWFWPKMWIYNVSGFDAVEIKLNNGKTYRIGTDEPKKLEQAIRSSIK